MALIKEYFDITKKYQHDYGDNIILLMQVGSFFEVYGISDKNTNTIRGSRIIEFSTICDLNIVDKNTATNLEQIVMAGFKDMQIEKYIKKIQDAGFTAIVYVQDESAKNTTRSLAGIFSPGTYFSNEPNKLTNNLTCIWVELVNNKHLIKGKHVVVGVSNIDIYTGKTSIFQFKETYLNNPTTYDELERYISIYKPSEAIIISNLPDKETNDIINFINLNCTSIHKINLSIEDEKQNTFTLRAKNCEKQNYQTEILNKYYKIEDYSVFLQNFYDNNIATQSFCFLLDFVNHHNPNMVSKISVPIFENCSERLILANHSLKQLNIIDDDNYTGKYSSVLKMLNICLTPMGKRKFAHNFLNPTTNVEYLQKEYNITSHIIEKTDLYNEFFKIKLASIKDVSKLKRQVILKKISPKSFCSLYKSLEIIKDIYEGVIQDTEMKEYLLNYETNTLLIEDYCNNIMSFIDENIDIDIASDLDTFQNFETNFIRNFVDKDLDEKMKLLNDSEDKLESIRVYLNNLINDKGKSSDFIKIHETEKNNYSLLCTNRRCKLLESALPVAKTNVLLMFGKDDLKEFIFKTSKTQFEFHKQSASNNSITDEQINGLCKNITSTKIALKDIITLVFNRFVSKFEMYQLQMESIINFITLLDVGCTKATIAQKYNFCKPTIVEADKSFINAKGLRHCLIEQLQTNELYVSNDVILGNGTVDGVLLYGTNAVGKTSFIRAIGISVIMAQSGLYVPSSEYIYKPYSYIFTRILGNDNIFKGLSTFAVEMSELRTILRLSDKNSLVLGDELCSGTENTSAVSIFVAGIQKLYELQSSFIFATHLHEIVSYDEIIHLKSVVLKHMEVVYNKELDALVYDRKIKDGPGTSMYGLEVCKSLSLPQEFLDAAYNIRAKYHPESGSILLRKTSHFNAKKIMSMCEKCGQNMGAEVHHLQHQKSANDNGIIHNADGSAFHKNAVANLITLCEKCHNEFHKTETNHKKVKTSKGYMLQKI